MMLGLLATLPLAVGCPAQHVVLRAPVLEGAIPNGMYVVLGEPYEVPRSVALPAGQRQLRYDPRMTDSASTEPMQWVVVETADYVPLILATAAEHTTQENGHILISVTLAKQHVTALAEFTRSHLGNRVALVLDGEVMSAHKVRTVIEGGRMQITRCDEHACQRILSKLAEMHDASKTPVTPSGPVPEERVVRSHLSLLSDELLEGRGTGQRGGELAVRYLETQLMALGLLPANGTQYRQSVTLSGVRLETEHSGLRFVGSQGSLLPVLGTDFAVGAAAAETQLAVDAPVVFVGHGIASSDGKRDDYKGIDVRGKLLLMLVGDRPRGPAMPLRCEPENYYGRWTYKFEEARRRGAAGVLLIHTDSSAGYGWQVIRNGWSQERFQRMDSEPRGTVQGWITEATAVRLFGLAGQDFRAVVGGADDLGFRPVSLSIRATGTLHSAVRSLLQWNVAGVLPGTDPELRKELVIFSAHWDHLGKAADGAVYAGAVDNATGCAAALSIAKVMVQSPPKRSVMFLFPAAEEQGLLGSSAYVARPLWPLERTVLNINLESLNVVGPTRDIGLLGSSDPKLLSLSAQAAAACGMVITPPKPDPAGLCFRSDHFPFVKAGVPALSPGFSLDGGWDYLGDKGAAQVKAASFLNHYHRPSDRYDPSWNLEGLMQQVRFALELGRLVGSSESWPARSVKR